jgi:hypothetical protein
MAEGTETCDTASPWLVLPLMPQGEGHATNAAEAADTKPLGTAELDIASLGPSLSPTRWLPLAALPLKSLSPQRRVIVGCAAGLALTYAVCAFFSGGAEQSLTGTAAVEPLEGIAPGQIRRMSQDPLRAAPRTATAPRTAAASPSPATVTANNDQIFRSSKLTARSAQAAAEAPHSGADPAPAEAAATPDAAAEPAIRVASAEGGSERVPVAGSQAVVAPGGKATPAAEVSDAADEPLPQTPRGPQQVGQTESRSGPQSGAGWDEGLHRYQTTDPATYRDPPYNLPSVANRRSAANR